MDLSTFIKRMKEIKEKGWITTHRAADTGVGKTLEDILGIRENNIDLPDLGETGELKAVRKNSGSLLTLFTLEPTRELTWKEMLMKYGYTDDQGRPALKSTFSCGQYNAQNIKAKIQEDKILILKKLSDESEVVLGYYNKQRLTKKFVEKIGNTLVYVPAQHRGSGANEQFLYDEVYIFKNFSGERFLEVMESGDLYIDFRVHLKPSGAGRSHGTGFRVRKNRIDEFYETKERIL